MSEEKKEETVAPMRQIIIETDGNSIGLIKAEVAGDIELLAILQRLTIAITDKMSGKYQK